MKVIIEFKLSENIMQNEDFFNWIGRCPLEKDKINQVK